MPDLTITRRNLPHWTLEGAWYYVTFRLRDGGLACNERDLVLEHIKAGHSRFYNLFAVCVMPDHVHVIMSPHSGKTLPPVMQRIKGGSSRSLNLLRGTGGAVWQEESWDRIIRDEPEFRQKLNYIFMNPVRAGLTKDPWAYAWWHLQS